jgi:hypothetical protein
MWRHARPEAGEVGIAALAIEREARRAPSSSTLIARVREAWETLQLAAARAKLTVWHAAGK